LGVGLNGLNEQSKEQLEESSTKSMQWGIFSPVQPFPEAKGFELLPKTSVPVTGTLFGRRKWNGFL